MPVRSRWSLALLVPLASAAPLAAQDAPKVAFSGYVTGSYTYSTKGTNGAIVGRYYDRLGDQFVLNAAKLVAELPVATDKVSAGFRVDGLFGTNAEVTKAAGFDLGTDGDITQAFVTLNLPTGKDTYVQFRAGKWATLMGLEVIEDPVNPNFSVGNLFVFVENFTMTGAQLYAKLSPKVEAAIDVVNGWDVVRDNNTKKSFMGRLAVTPSDKFNVAFLGYAGPEQAGNGDNWRYGGEVLATVKPASKATVIGQFDYGTEEGLLADPTQKAKWWGASLWFTYDVSPNVGLALRGDYVDDKDGVRTSNYFYGPATRRKFGSGTATLNIKTVPHMLIRPEVRLDGSNLADYDASKSQVSFALGATYIF